MIAKSQGWNESDCLWIGREMNTQSNCHLHCWHCLDENQLKLWSSKQSWEWSLNDNTGRIEMVKKSEYNRRKQNNNKKLNIVFLISFILIVYFWEEMKWNDLLQWKKCCRHQLRAEITLNVIDRHREAHSFRETVVSILHFIRC